MRTGGSAQQAQVRPPAGVAGVAGPRAGRAGGDCLGIRPDLFGPGRRGAGIEGGRCSPGPVGRQQLWRLLRQRAVPAVAGQVDARLTQRAGVAARRPVDGRRVPGPVTCAQFPPGVAAVPPEVRRGSRADHRAVTAQLDDDALPVVAVVAVERWDVGVGGARVGQVLPVLEVGEAVALQAVDVEHRPSRPCAGGVATAAEVDRLLAVAAFGDEPGRLARGQLQVGGVAAGGSGQACARGGGGGQQQRQHQQGGAGVLDGCLRSLSHGANLRITVWRVGDTASRVCGKPPRQDGTGALRSAIPASVPSRIASSNDRGPSVSPARTTSAPVSCSAANSPTPQALRPSFTTSVSIPSSTCSRSENTLRNVAVAPSQPVSRRWCTRSIPASSIRPRYMLRWYWCTASPKAMALVTSRTSWPACASCSASTRPVQSPPQSQIVTRRPASAPASTSQAWTVPAMPAS